MLGRAWKYQCLQTVATRLFSCHRPPLGRISGAEPGMEPVGLLVVPVFLGIIPVQSILIIQEVID
jgi:hypothetical protein